MILIPWALAISSKSRKMKVLPRLAAKVERQVCQPWMDPETTADYVSKYKKTLLAKRQAHRDVLDRLDKEKPKDAAYPGLLFCACYMIHGALLS